MKYQITLLTSALVGLCLILAACAPVAPSPVPTTPPTAAPKAAAPTTAPATAPTAASSSAAPTAAPAPAKVNFPEKGRSISFIVPFAAGGSADLGARLMAAAMEPDLGVPVQVINKEGAGGQVGDTEMVLSKPDGYTWASVNNLGVPPIYLDPDRKAVWGRKDITLVAENYSSPHVMAVKADSPFKTVKDVVDAVRADPNKINLGTGGILSTLEIVATIFESTAGIKFHKVNTGGGAQNVTMLLGGHVDVTFNNLSEVSSAAKSGQVRILGITTAQPSPLAPDIPTFVSQGYNVVITGDQGIAVPAATPKEMVDIISASAKRALETSKVQDGMTKIGLQPNYKDGKDWAADWDKLEPVIKQLVDESKRQ